MARSRLIEIPHDNDAFLAFKTEVAARAERKPKAVDPPPRRALTVWVVAVMVLLPVGAGVISWARLPAAAPAAAPAVTAAPARPGVVESTVTISSRPEGATVRIGGKSRGTTPLRITLPVGEYSVELRRGSAVRTVPLTVEAGVSAAQYIEIESAAVAPDRSSGRLEVLSEPVGARVTVDGVPRGVTPLSLAKIAAGQHRVVLTGAGGTFSRTVTVASGATATVVASLAPPTVTVGWVVVDSPLELTVHSGGRRLGTGLDRIILPAGTHVLELVNEQYRYQTTTTVDVTAGRTSIAKIDVPLGRISINATPWAEVLIDGRSAGTTPLAHISVPIGLHEIVWRHPGLGERRQVVAVTAEQPVRVGMDFKR